MEESRSELLKLVAKHDPDNKFAMPYMWATTGIGYNVDKVKAVLGENAPVDSWDLILKPENLEKLKSCGVSFWMRQKKFLLPC